MSESNLQIVQADNGYILESSESTHVALSLEDLFDHILKRFEGRDSTVDGDKYGRVIILRCRCHYQNRVGKGAEANACSECSPRLLTSQS